MIYTRSKFYYGHTINQNNNIILFNEGSGDLEATIPNGSYSLTDYVTAVIAAMNTVSSNSYSASLDRSTRKITISGTSNFTLDITNSGVGTSAYPLMGFTSDKTGSNSYEGDTGSGSEYLPQFWLQDYVDFEYNKKFLQGTVKESASGIPEVVSFGLSTSMRANITFINDFEHSDNSSIEENTSGLDDAIDFMDYAINKGPMEFIKDRDTTSSYTKVILSSTPESSDGIGYRLKELTSRGVSDYYETGLLEFRAL